MFEFIDLRKLNRNELFLLRRYIVRLKKKGKSGKEIELLTRVRSNRVSEIWHKYLKSGMRGLRPAAPGRKAGEKTLLSGPMEREIRQTMIDNTPDGLKMSYSLWTCQVAAEYIKREYDVRLSMRSMTNYLKKWGFVSRPPIRDAVYRENAAFMRFLEEDFPAVVRRAGSENVGIYWFCETGIEKGFRSNGGTRPRRINMIAAMTARGTARFSFFEGRISQERFIALMSRLIRYADRKVFFIAADNKAFRGEKVRSWLKGRENQIEIFYHPAGGKP